MRITDRDQIVDGMEVYAVWSIGPTAEISKYLIQSAVRWRAWQDGGGTIVVDTERLPMDDDSRELTFCGDSWQLSGKLPTATRKMFFLRDYGVEASYNNHRLYTSLYEAKMYAESQVQANVRKKTEQTRILQKQDKPEEVASAYDNAMKSVTWF